MNWLEKAFDDYNLDMELAEEKAEKTLDEVIVKGVIIMFEGWVGEICGLYPEKGRIEVFQYSRWAKGATPTFFRGYRHIIWNRELKDVRKATDKELNNLEDYIYEPTK